MGKSFPSSKLSNGQERGILHTQARERVKKLKRTNPIG